MSHPAGCSCGRHLWGTYVKPTPFFPLVRDEIPAAYRRKPPVGSKLGRSYNGPLRAGTGDTDGEAPKFPLSCMKLVRTPAVGAGDGGSTPSRPTERG